VRKVAGFLYSSIIVFCMLFFSCSRQDISVKITQYTDPAYVTGIAQYQGDLYCATRGGLVKWDLTSREYTIITTADGLPSNVLTDVLVDGENRLWVSSREGLGMFNGTSWRKYGVSHGLPSPEINDLTLNKSGKLWVGTEDGAAYFDRGRFKLLAETGSPGRKQINFVYFDKGNNLWICTEKNGIFYRINNEWKHSVESTGLQGNTAKIITQSWDLKMWSSSSRGIFIWDGVGWRWYPSFDRLGTIEANYLTSTDTRLWFFTSNGVYASHGNEWIQYTAEEGLMTNNVTTGLVESDNRIYVGSVNGLSIIDNGTVENFHIPNNPVGYNYISLSIDNRGRVWLGTWETGLSLYDSGYWTQLTGKNPDDVSTVRGTIFGPDGTIAFNTTSGVVLYKDDEWKKYTRRNGISGNDVRCGVFDRKGRYWIGTSAGISRMENGSWKRFRKIHGLPSEDVWACGVDSNDTVWFGTVEGIVSFNGDELNDRTPEIGLEEVDVRSILVKDNTVYFGTNSGNLIVYKNGKWNVFSNGYLGTKKAILTMASDPTGALWLGTFGDGIIRLKNGKTGKITMSDGLPFNVVRSVAYNDGVLWAACYGGVAKIELEVIGE